MWPVELPDWILGGPLRSLEGRMSILVPTGLPAGSTTRYPAVPAVSESVQSAVAVSWLVLDPSSDPTVIG